jgi:hypothetical protein
MLAIRSSYAGGAVGAVCRAREVAARTAGNQGGNETSSS